MRGRNLLLIPSALLLAFALGSAPAEAGKIYVGGGVGQTSVDFTLADADDGSFTSGSVDDSDTNWRIFVGYRFLKFFALEADWFDMGGFSFDAVSDGSGSSYSAGAVSGDAEADGYRIAAIGILPIGERFSLFAKYGQFFWDASLAETNGGMTVSFSDDDDDDFYGAGLGYDLPGPVTLRLEYEMITLGDLDIDVVGVAAAFRF